MAHVEKRRSIFSFYRNNADFLICQETHSSPEDETIWEKEWGGKAIFSHGDTNSRGVAIFYSQKYHNNVNNVYRDIEGRIIILDIEVQGEFITLVALYAPNKDTPEFFSKLAGNIRLRYTNKVIIGDFNLTLDVDLDRLDTYTKARNELENVMDEFTLRDIWRIQNGQKREYSWFKGGHSNKASRIDLALISAGLDQSVKVAQYLAGVKTDHRAMYICFEISPSDRGVGYWKFNTKYLKDINFVSSMKQQLEACIERNGKQEPDHRWELIKKEIKKIATKYARERVCEEKIVIAQLAEKVNEYEVSFPLNKEEHDLWQKTKADFEEKLQEQAKAIIFRSKVKWYEEGEQNSRYFFSLEKARYNAKTCYKIINEENFEIVDPKLILEEQRKFYEKLYSVDEDVCFTLINQSGIQVPESIKQDQDNQILICELEEAIRTMNNNKTPGSDGIPVDFYKVFWSSLKIPFYQMMVYTFEQGMLHESARQGVLNLIPKDGRDSRYIKNLRPITLLNTDYKIIEKAIANKMIPALEHIIHTDQRGFMKNRRISVNIRKMLDIMHMADKEDLEAIVMSLDFVKCFDKCSFSILHGSLKFFGFGTIVQEWTRILYDAFSVRVQNNGHFSESLPIKKGVHQGGCCSSVYFLVIAEILAMVLRDNEDIKGITIADIKNILNQFADDMDIFSYAERESIMAIFQELDKFRKQSGFTVSYDKTTLYRIGSLKHSNANLYDMTQYAWSNQDISVLGVTIAHQNIVEKNYDPIVKKCRVVMNAWYNRGLSLIGKIQVINSLVSSLFVYKMMVLPKIPEKIVRIVEAMIREFLWNGKKAKIALSVLQNSKKEGGLNLVNLRNKDIALKATWPKILFHEEEYSCLVYKIMRTASIGDDIWRVRLLPEHVKYLRVGNEFWVDVLKSWSTYNFNHNFRIENQIIWYNSCITIKDRPIMWRDMYNKGLKYVY